MALNSEFLTAAQEFIDFLAAQKGAYTDACAGFRRNHAKIKPVVATVLKKARRTLTDAGVPSIVHTKVIDPKAPDIVVQTTRLSRDYLAANVTEGANEQQICRAIIVFVFTYWEVVTRGKLAAAVGEEKNLMLMPIAGDLRLLRIALLHHGGIIRTEDHAKLEVLGDQFESGQPLSFNHTKMHKVFDALDRGIALLTVTKLNIPSPPGGWDDIRQIAYGAR